MRKSHLRSTAGSLGSDRVFVDTSAWIALFSARDQHHVLAEHQMRRILGRGLSMITTNLVIAEIHRLVLHRVGIVAAARAMTHIEAEPKVSIVFANEAHPSAAKSWLARIPGMKLTYADAVSFSVMQEIGCALSISFDSDFLATGFRAFDA